MDDIDKLKRLLGRTLLEARRKAGLSQADVSSQVGLVPDVYGRIEQGLQLPSVPTLHRLCSTLHLSASALLGLDTEEQAAPPEPEVPDDPELLHLANLLRVLSPSELRSLAALATVISRGRAREEPPAGDPEE